LTASKTTLPQATFVGIAPQWPLIGCRPSSFFEIQTSLPIRKEGINAILVIGPAHNLRSAFKSQALYNTDLSALSPHRYLALSGSRITHHEPLSISMAGLVIAPGPCLTLPQSQHAPLQSSNRMNYFFATVASVIPKNIPIDAGQQVKQYPMIS
jgi:hypothetical protein